MKFIYADDATGTGAGAPVDVAAAMAKGGVQTGGDEDTAEIPNVVIEEKKEVAAAAVEAKVEPVETKAAEVAVESPKAAESTVSPNVELDWKEHLKKAEKAAILKELGYDEKMIGFFNTWSAGGDINNYVKAASIDYSKMSPEQLLKQQLHESYPEFSPEDLDDLYQAKVIEHYKLDPELNSEAEVRRGKLLLTADAKAIRETMIQRQKDFILNAKPPELPDYRKEYEEQTRQQSEAQTRALESYTNTLNGHAATKELLTKKTLAIGEGDEKFNYEMADPTKAIKVLTDPTAWAQSIFNADGSPQIEKQLFLAAAVTDHQHLASQIFKAGKAIGAKQAVEQIENAKKPEATTASPEVPLTPAQALARQGVLSNQG